MNWENDILLRFKNETNGISIKILSVSVKNARIPNSWIRKEPKFKIEVQNP